MIVWGCLVEGERKGSRKRKWTLIANGYRVSVCDGGNVLKLDYVDGCTTYACIIEIVELHTLNR